MPDTYHMLERLWTIRETQSVPPRASCPVENEGIK